MHVELVFLSREKIKSYRGNLNVVCGIVCSDFPPEYFTFESKFLLHAFFISERLIAFNWCKIICFSFFGFVSGCFSKYLGHKVSD